MLLFGSPSKYLSKNQKSSFRLTFLGMYSKIRVEYFAKTGLKGVAVALFGLKLWENEATRSRILFKSEFWPTKA